MIAILAAAAILSSSGQEGGPVQKDFSMDLFLTGGNPSPVSGTDWLDKPANDTPVEALLRGEIAKLQQSGQIFMLLDGGDCSVFPKVMSRQVSFVVRKDAVVPTLSESYTKNGVTHTKLSNYRRMVTGSSGGVNPLPFSSSSLPRSYIAQTSLYLPPSLDAAERIVFQDLVSYRTTLRDVAPQDRVSTDELVVASSESVESTIQEIDKNGEFQGVCFCAWGLLDPAKPNFVSFPPAGVVGHYIFYRKDHRLGLKFLGYIGSPTDYWSENP